MSKQVFKPSRTLTFDTVQSNSNKLLELFGHDKEDLLHLDLSEVTKCDSAGLALLVEAKRLSKKYHKTLVIMKMPAAIAALAEFCGVDEMLRSNE